MKNKNSVNYSNYGKPWCARMLFNALGHARKYSSAELVQAMDVLLRCNRQLVSSSTDDTLILQQALVRIVSKAA